MLREKDFSFERGSSDEKSEETIVKSPIFGEDSSRKEKFQRSVDLRPTEVTLLKNSDETMVDPQLHIENEGRAPPIPVKEIKKAGQKPRRILPYLPPVVKELLRWSVHPDQVLRGAASVSYLLTLPVIEEEALPTADLNETIGEPGVLKKKRMLPSIPTTHNRALPSKVRSQVEQQVLKSKAKFRRRMLPTLPMIRKQMPTIPTGEKSKTNAPEERKTTYKSEVKEELQSLEHVIGRQEHAATVPSVSDDHSKAKRENLNKLPLGSNVLLDVRLPEELPSVRAKLARSNKTMLERSERRALHSEPMNTRPVLPQITKKEQTVQKPLPTVTRRQPKILPTVNRSTPNSQLLVSKAPSSLEPTMKGRSITDRPIPGFQTVQQEMRPKQPLTSRPNFTRPRPKIPVVQKPQSSNIQVANKQTTSILRSPSPKRIVKQPLASVQLDESCLFRSSAETTVKENSKPLLMKSQVDKRNKGQLY
ncbi:neurofilament heavy polypeptide-like [Acropora millepora]|uniref:neurofilament heavy polypeptide-like n=1 Tax=Acropora millepora TaxID=45264 RepID=UPI001CF4E760|nr:neurofilament heavy polypeptide-like [Acropora millepora]